MNDVMIGDPIGLHLPLFVSGSFFINPTIHQQPQQTSIFYFSLQRNSICTVTVINMGIKDGRTKGETVSLYLFQNTNLHKTNPNGWKGQ